MDAQFNILLLNIHYNLPVHRTPSQRHGGGGGTSDARDPLHPPCSFPQRHTHTWRLDCCFSHGNEQKKQKLGPPCAVTVPEERPAKHTHTRLA